MVDKVAEKCSLIQKIESRFEKALWGIRYIMLAGVLMSVLGAVMMIVYTTLHDATKFIYQAFLMLTHEAEVSSESAMSISLTADVVRYMVKMIDGYLMSGILLIVGFGMYELFISEFDHFSTKEGEECKRIRGKILNIKDIDTLKSKLVKMILIVLIVKFFSAALDIKITTITDMVSLAGGIALIGLAVYLTHNHND